MEEIWLPVKDYEGYYEVSNLGRIKRLFKFRKYREYNSKILKFKVSDFGYLSIGLTKDGNKKFFLIHRLVAFAFLSKTENRNSVNHIDRNKSNNCVLNLEWVSNMENSCHYRKQKNTGTLIGVYKLKKYDKYVAKATFEGKRIFLGYHNTAEKAYEARIEYLKSKNIINKYS